jgi:superfamily II DNA/RNA helicase
MSGVFSENSGLGISLPAAWRSAARGIFILDDFVSLGVLPAFAEKLKERNISGPTAVQRLAIPFLLSGKGLVFRSATGTGKTFAWLIPALQRLLADIGPGGASPYQGPRVLICAPTYELCSQIKEEAAFLSPLPAALLIGSASMNRQIETLKKTKPLVAVGNPGRLLALAKMGKLKLQGLRFLALDEADRMTAEESREETGELLRLVSRAIGGRAGEGGLTVAACSATISAGTRDALAALLPVFKNAEFAETDEQEILRERIEHWALFSESRRKTQTLRSFLAAVRPKKALVFAGRTDNVGKIAAALQYHHISALGLCSDMDKKSRKQAVDGFRSGKISVLVASDLAARGLDIADLSHVVALDVPGDGEAYIHRAGRTGRAGKRGVMASIGDEAEMRRLAILEKKLNITVHPKELYGGKVCSPEPESFPAAR